MQIRCPPKNPTNTKQSFITYPILKRPADCTRPGPSRLSFRPKPRPKQCVGELEIPGLPSTARTLFSGLRVSTHGKQAGPLVGFYHSAGRQPANSTPRPAGGEGKTKPIKHKIRFIDSFKFMSASLDSLVNNLPDDAFNNLKKYYKGEKLSLVRRKGVYPYEYMNSLERFKENKLPPKEAFYSRLAGEGISDEDYEHAKKVWKVFGMKTLQDYHDLYNVIDVLLLADVFENFRNLCMENYNLDPAHYFTAPGLSLDACLKITGVELELLSDINMLLIIEEGIRGGVSMISNRYGKANNKYMGKSFNEKEPSKYIQ